jgi:hypothetical protein
MIAQPAGFFRFRRRRGAEADEMIGWRMRGWRGFLKTTAVVAALVFVFLSGGRASAFSLTMAPPAGTVPGQIVQCPALANNAGVNGWYTIIDQKCALALINQGWAVNGANLFWLSGAADVVVSNTAANYFPAVGTDTPVASTAEAGVAQIAHGPTTISKLYCNLTTAAGVVTVAGGTNYVVVLRKNEANTALTCTIGATASSCSDLVDQVTAVQGDQLDYGITPTGTPTALVPHCVAKAED